MVESMALTSQKSDKDPFASEEDDSEEEENEVFLDSYILFFVLVWKFYKDILILEWRIGNSIWRIPFVKTHYTLV